MFSVHLSALVTDVIDAFLFLLIFKVCSHGIGLSPVILGAALPLRS